PPKHEVDDAFPAVFTTHRIELTVLGLTAQLLEMPLQYGVQTLITDHQCVGVTEDPCLALQNLVQFAPLLDRLADLRLEDKLLQCGEEVEPIGDLTSRFDHFGEAGPLEDALELLLLRLR